MRCENVHGSGHDLFEVSIKVLVCRSQEEL